MSTEALRPRVVWLLPLLVGIFLGVALTLLPARSHRSLALVPAGAARLDVTVYGAHARRGITFHLHDRRVIARLTDDLDGLAPFRSPGTCPPDLGAYDRLRFLYSGGNRWTVRVMTSGCQRVVVPGTGVGSVSRRFIVDLSRALPGMD